MEDSRMGISFIVTHGDKHSGPNPGMTEEGFDKIRKLREALFPTRMDGIDVISGTGKRHFDVAKALGLEITRFTAVAGGPDSLDNRDGQKVIVFADGTEVLHGKGVNTTVEDESVAAVQLIANLRPGSVVCAGRPLMIGLNHAGYPNSMKSTSVYAVRNYDGRIESIVPIAEDGNVGVGKDEI